MDACLPLIGRRLDAREHDLMSSCAYKGSIACGRSGIRTHDRLAPMAVFKTAALNHSAILPNCCRDVVLFQGSVAVELAFATRSPRACLSEPPGSQRQPRSGPSARCSGQGAARRQAGDPRAVRRLRGGADKGELSRDGWADHRRHPGRRAPATQQRGRDGGDRGDIPESWRDKPAKLRDARWTVKASKTKPAQDGAKPAVESGTVRPRRRPWLTTGALVGAQGASTRRAPPDGLVAFGGQDGRNPPHGFHRVGNPPIRKSCHADVVQRLRPPQGRGPDKDHGRTRAIESIEGNAQLYPDRAGVAPEVVVSTAWPRPPSFCRSPRGSARGGRDV